MSLLKYFTRRSLPFKSLITNQYRFNTTSKNSEIIVTEERVYQFLNELETFSANDFVHKEVTDEIKNHLQSQLRLLEEPNNGYVDESIPFFAEQIKKHKAHTEWDILKFKDGDKIQKNNEYLASLQPGEFDWRKINKQGYNSIVSLGYPIFSKDGNHVSIYIGSVWGEIMGIGCTTLFEWNENEQKWQEIKQKLSWIS